MVISDDIFFTHDDGRLEIYVLYMKYLT